MSLEELVARLAWLNAQIEELTIQRDEIKTELRGLAVVDAEHPNAELQTENGTVALSVNRRLDVRKVMAAYPVTQYPRFYKPTPDTAALKKGLAPEAYEGLMSVVGEAKVTLR